MSIKKCISTCLLLLMYCPVYTSGQIKGDDIKGKDVSDLKSIFEEIKKIREVSYDYSLKVHYPNDQTDQIKGKVYINDTDKQLYNDCDAFTMIYNAHWFYKADHRKKTITIIDLDKEQNKKLKAGIEKDVFQNGALVNFIDSIVLKGGKMEFYSKNDDTVKVELGFTKGIIKSVTINYDQKENRLIDYRIKTFQAMEQKKKQLVGITQEIFCDDFSANNDKAKYESGNFFYLNKGKIVLKRYNNYKLYSKP